jgi:60 kDa SS-A/Ro ribonucleoprotein
MTNYAGIFKAPTPQTQPIPGKTMIQMPSGGYAFQISALDQVKRFLILGAAGGTYYAQERPLVVENALALHAAFKEHGPAVVDLIMQVSKDGLAPRNKPALFALAAAISYEADVEVRRRAVAALPHVARTLSDLMYFVSQAQQMRGWGRTLKRAVASWFEQQPIDRLVNQVIKYRNREGFTTADLLRLTHPHPGEDAVRDAIFNWVVDGQLNAKASYTALTSAAYNRLVSAHVMMTGGQPLNLAPTAIREHNLPREVIPTEYLNDKAVWAALAEQMPMHAMVRNLGKMTNVGLLDDTEVTKRFTTKLRDQTAVQKSRLHPFAVLQALKVYAQGRGDKGKLTWTPNAKIIDALNDAFYLAFKNAEVTGKRILCGIDISGSMTFSSALAGGMTAAQVAAAQAVLFAAIEENTDIVGFTTQVYDTPVITAKSRLDDVLARWPGRGEGTDCAAPIAWAERKGKDYDAIVLITDAQSWAGTRHVSEQLAQYRKNVGHPVKYVEVMCYATNNTLADPQDPDTLLVAGFDASIGQLITTFLR